MMSTRLASSRSVGFSPKALTSVVMFFLASGRDMARMAGLRGFFRKRKISYAGPQHSVRSHVQSNCIGLLATSPTGGHHISNHSI